MHKRTGSYFSQRGLIYITLRFIPSIIAFLLFIPFLQGCSEEKKDHQPIGTIKANTIKAEEVTLPETRYFPGNVRSKESIRLAAKLPGYIKKIPVQIGDPVKRGELLVLIDDTDVLARIRALKSKMDSYRSRLKALSAELEYDRKNYMRFKRLFSEDAATRDELDRASTAFRAKKNRVISIKKEIKALKARLREAENQLSYVKINSPVNGIVSGRYADPGTYVDPGTTIMEVEGTERGFWFEAEIDSSLAPMIMPGNRVTVSIPYIGFIKTVPISHIRPSLNRSTRTFTILADLGYAHVMPGAFGRVYIRTGKKKTLIIPKRVVISRGGIKGVYTVDDSSMIRWRIIKIGKSWKKKGPEYTPFFSGLTPPFKDTFAHEPKDIMVAVLSGLRPGDKIISDNLTYIKEGTRLEQK